MKRLREDRFCMSSASKEILIQLYGMIYNIVVEHQFNHGYQKFQQNVWEAYILPSERATRKSLSTKNSKSC